MVVMVSVVDHLSWAYLLIDLIFRAKSGVGFYLDHVWIP